MEESSIEIRVTEDKGRCLFALKHFSDGDIIFEEVPIVSSQFQWNEDCRYSACEYCLRPLETAEENARRLTQNPGLVLPYPEACTVHPKQFTVCPSCGVKYCSEQCQSEAWNRYHKTLCLRKLDRDGSHPMEVLRDTWKQIHYPPETASIMLCAKIIAFVQQASDSAQAMATFSQFANSSGCIDETIYKKLLGVKFTDQIDTLRNSFLAAINMEKCELWSTPEGFLSLISLMAMNGQGIGTSSFSKWVATISEKEGPVEEKTQIESLISSLYDQLEISTGLQFLNNEGAGLYVLQSKCNHSCVPNAEIAFTKGDHRLSLRCIKEITPGTEICISYLDECSLARSRHSRNKVLRSNYLFTCTCSRCLSEMDDPDVTSDSDSEFSELASE